MQPASPDTAPVSLNIGGQDAQTDDRGAFRLSGAPAKYHVRVNPPGNMTDQTPEIRTDGTLPVIYGATWYPGATDEEQAAPIEAKPGAEVSGIEIRLARAAPHQKHGLVISGTIHSLPAGALSAATVWLQHGPKTRQMNSTESHGIDADGGFTLREQEPGFYRAWAVYSDSKTHLQSQPIEFQAEADVTGLQLTLEAGAEISGTIEAPGDRPGVPREKRTIRIGYASAESGPDGAFHLTGISPDKYNVEMDPLPENGCIQSMMLDSTTISGASLDFTHGVRGSKLKVSVAICGQLSGAVLEKDGQRAVNSWATVVLFPAASDVDVDLRQMASVDEEGTYRFHSVPPGKYHLAAIDLLASPLFDRPEAVKKFAEQGELIEIKLGDRIAKDIKFLENADAKK
jgi:hypothetical protein